MLKNLNSKYYQLKTPSFKWFLLFLTDLPQCAWPTADAIESAIGDRNFNQVARNYQIL